MDFWYFVPLTNRFYLIGNFLVVGARGAPGPLGPAGRPGSQGLVGPTGSKGDRGDPGLRGMNPNLLYFVYYSHLGPQLINYDLSK